MTPSHLKVKLADRLDNIKYKLPKHKKYRYLRETINFYYNLAEVQFPIIAEDILFTIREEHPEYCNVFFF